MVSPNVALINFDGRAAPSPLPANLFSAASFYQTAGPPHAQHYSPYCNLSPAVSTNHLSVPSSSTAAPSHLGTSSLNNILGEESSTSLTIVNQMEQFQSQDALLSEIKRLRERLLTLETENASMSMKLNQQQWQVENR